MKRDGKTVKFLVICMAMVLITGSIYAPAQAKSKGYKFSYKGASVYMKGPAKKIIRKAGTPLAKKVKKSCAYKGKDRTYKYTDFILYTYSKSEKGKEYVNGITFLTSRVSTKEGIRIGSTLSQVTKKYGKAKGRFGVYTYKKGSCKLQIEITDNKVSNLRYVASK